MNTVSRQICKAKSMLSHLTRVYSLRALILSQFGKIVQGPLNYFNGGGGFFTLPVTILSGVALIWGAVLNWIFLPPISVTPMRFYMGVIPVCLFSAAFTIIYISLRRGFSRWGVGIGENVFYEGFGGL